MKANFLYTLQWRLVNVMNALMWKCDWGKRLAL